MKELIEEARSEALPDRLLDSLDGLDSGCIRLLLCKSSIVIRAAQESLKNKGRTTGDRVRSFTAWLPTREEFEGNSDECEDKYTDCRLFPELWVRGRSRGRRKRERERRREEESVERRREENDRGRQSIREEKIILKNFSSIFQFHSRGRYNDSSYNFTLYREFWNQLFAILFT